MRKVLERLADGLTIALLLAATYAFTRPGTPVRSAVEGWWRAFSEPRRIAALWPRLVSEPARHHERADPHHRVCGLPVSHALVCHTAARRGGSAVRFRAGGAARPETIGPRHASLDVSPSTVCSRPLRPGWKRLGSLGVTRTWRITGPRGALWNRRRVAAHGEGQRIPGTGDAMPWRTAAPDDLDGNGLLRKCGRFRLPAAV
jgi:hypothetical protein